MKTLHLTNSWHARSGGIATFYRALIDAANRHGHHIRLIVPAETGSIETVGEFGRIYHVQSPPALLNRAYRTIYPSRFLRPGSALQRILLEERPDLVEICDKYTLNYLGALLRRQLLQGFDFRPAVIGFSCERMDDNFRTYVGSFPLSQQFCAFYMRWLYFPFFDHHIANSEYTADELRRAARGQIISRGTWIRHMGVDLTHMSPARKSPDLRRRLLGRFSAGDDAILLLYAGRLVPEKNLQLLFELLDYLVTHEHLNARLLIAGDGIDRIRWETETANRLPGHARFLGHIADPNELADLYANCDIFAHPNPREPFGIAPLEAMASGLPLLAPNAGGVTSYANLSNAWTVPADVHSFAAAIAEIRADEGRTALKIQHALATAQSYRWENVAASFLDLYRQLHAIQTSRTEPFAPSFSSTPPTPWGSALFHSVSRAAEKAFRTGSRVFFKPNREGTNSHHTPEPASSRSGD